MTPLCEHPDGEAACPNHRPRPAPELDWVTLNALVTFAAENVPGGLSDRERAVALAVGKRALQAHDGGLARGVNERLFSMGVWTWLAIVEDEADRLSEGGRNALALLREDLERMAAP